MADENNEVLLFETYGAEGNIIRSGRVFDSVCSIGKLNGEVLIKFTDNYGNLIDETDLAEGSINTVENPICFVAQNGPVVSCYINAYFDKCTKVIYYKTKNANNSTLVDLTRPQIDITIETGEYTFDFYLADNTKVKSIRTCFYVNDKSEDIKTIKLYNKDSGILTDELYERLELLKESESDILDDIMSMHKDIVKTDEKTAWFKILHTWIHIYNNRLNSLNRNISSKLTVCNIRGENILCEGIDKVMVYTMTDQLARTYEVDEDNKCWLSLKNDSTYKIVGLSSNDIAAVMYVYIPEDEISVELWRQKIEEIDDINALDSLSADYSPFTSEEQELAKIQEIKDPYFPLLSMPEITEDLNTGSIVVNIGTDDYSFIKVFGKNVYTVFQEYDNVITPTVERKIEMAAQTVRFNKAQHYISDADKYFVWLQDEDGNILSSLYLYDPKNTEAGEYSSFSQKMHLIYIKDYIDNLMSVLNENDSDDTIIIKRLAEFYKDDMQITEANFHIHLINELKTITTVYNFKKIVESIYQTMLLMSNRMDAFFDVPVYYKKDINFFTFAPKVNPYVLEVLKINSSGETYREFIRSGNSAIDYEIQEDKYDYYLFRCIDEGTLYTSGFIIACEAKNSKTIGSWNLEMQVINYGEDA